MTVGAIAMTIYLSFSGTYIGSFRIISIALLASLLAPLVGIISFLVFIVALVWYYRATKNIHSFGAKMVTSTAMAVIWWFIPIFFLWKPYHVTQHIWEASNPEVHLIEGFEWKKSPSSISLKQWWALLNCNCRVDCFWYFFWNIHGFWYGIRTIRSVNRVNILRRSINNPISSTYDHFNNPLHTNNKTNIYLAESQIP